MPDVEPTSFSLPVNALHVPEIQFSGRVGHLDVILYLGRSNLQRPAAWLNAYICFASPMLENRLVVTKWGFGLKESPECGNTVLPLPCLSNPPFAETTMFVISPC